MKKLIVIIVLVSVMGVLMTAAAPLKLPDAELKGRLMWERTSVCGVSDYVPTHAMTKLYLTGKFEPSHGLLVGCQVAATGNIFRAGHCDYFSVDTYKITCPMNQPPVVDH